MSPHRRYEIVVIGGLSSTETERFGPLTVRTVRGDTAIGGDGLDASMLLGVLLELECIGAEVRAVTSYVERAGMPTLRLVEPA